MISRHIIKRVTKHPHTRIFWAILMMVSIKLAYSDVSIDGVVEVRLDRGYTCDDGAGQCDTGWGFIRLLDNSHTFCSGPESNDIWLRDVCDNTAYTGVEPDDLIFTQSEEDDDAVWVTSRDRGHCQTTRLMFERYNEFFTQSGSYAETNPTSITACNGTNGTWVSDAGAGDDSFNNFIYNTRIAAGWHEITSYSYNSATNTASFGARIPSPSTNSTVNWLINNDSSSGGGSHVSNSWHTGTPNCGILTNYCQRGTGINNPANGNWSATNTQLIPDLGTWTSRTYWFHVWGADGAGDYTSQLRSGSSITVPRPVMDWTGGTGFVNKGVNNSTGAFCTGACGTVNNADSFGGDTYEFQIKYNSVIDGVTGPTNAPTRVCVQIDTDGDGLSNRLENVTGDAIRATEWDPIGEDHCIPLTGTYSAARYIDGSQGVILTWSGVLDYESNSEKGNWRYRFRIRPQNASYDICFPSGEATHTTNNTCDTNDWIGNTGNSTANGTLFQVRAPSLHWTTGAEYATDPAFSLRGLGSVPNNAADEGYGIGGVNHSDSFTFSVDVIARDSGGGDPNIIADPAGMPGYFDTPAALGIGTAAQDAWESDKWGFNDGIGAANPCNYTPRVEIDFQQDGTGLEDEADFCIILEKAATTAPTWRETWQQSGVKIPFTDRNQAMNVPGANCPTGNNGGGEEIQMDCTGLDGTDYFKKAPWDFSLTPNNALFWNDYQKYRYRFVFENWQGADIAGLEADMTGEPLYDDVGGTTITHSNGDPSDTNGWADVDTRHIKILKNPLQIGYDMIANFGNDGYLPGPAVHPNCAYGGAWTSVGQAADWHSNPATIGEWNYPFTLATELGTLNTDADSFGTGTANCSSDISPDWEFQIWVRDVDNIGPQPVTATNSSQYGDPFDITDDQPYVIIKIDFNDDGNYSSSDIFGRDTTLREIQIMDMLTANEWYDGNTLEKDFPVGKLRSPSIFNAISATSDGIVGYYFETQTRYFSSSTFAERSEIAGGCSTTCNFPTSQGGGTFEEPIVAPTLGGTDAPNADSKFIYLAKHKPFLAATSYTLTTADSWIDSVGSETSIEYETDLHAGTTYMVPYDDASNASKRNRQAARDGMSDLVGDPHWRWRVRYVDFDGFLPTLGAKRADGTWPAYLEFPERMGFNRASLFLDLNDDGAFAGDGSSDGVYGYPDATFDDIDTDKDEDTYNPTGERFSFQTLDTPAGTAPIYADYEAAIPNIYYRGDGTLDWYVAFFADNVAEATVDAYNPISQWNSGIVAEAEDGAGGYAAGSPHKQNSIEIINSRPWLEWCGTVDESFTMAITEGGGGNNSFNFSDINGSTTAIDLSGDKTDIDRLDQDGVHPLNVNDEPFGNFQFGSNRYWPEDDGHPDAKNGHIGNVTTTTDSLLFCVRYYDYDRNTPDPDRQHLLLDLIIEPGNHTDKSLVEWSIVKMTEMTRGVNAPSARRDRDSHPFEGIDSGYKQAGMVFGYLLTDARAAFPKNSQTFDATAEKVNGDPNGIYGFLFSDSDTSDPTNGYGGFGDDQLGADPESGQHYANHVARNFLQAPGTVDSTDWRVDTDLNAFYHIHDDSAQVSLLGQKNEFLTSGTDDDFRMTNMADVIQLTDSAQQSKAVQNIQNRNQVVDYWTQHISIGSDSDGTAMVKEIKKTNYYVPGATSGSTNCVGNMAGKGTPSYRAFEDPNPPQWNAGTTTCINPDPKAPEYEHNESQIASRSHCEGSLARLFIPKIIRSGGGTCPYFIYSQGMGGFDLGGYRSQDGILSWFTHGAAGPSSAGYQDNLTAGAATPWTELGMSVLLAKDGFTKNSSNITYAYGYSGTVFEFKASRKHKADRTMAGVLVDTNLNGVYENINRDTSLDRSEFFGYVNESDEFDSSFPSILGKPDGDLNAPNNSGDFGRRFSFHVNIAPENIPDEIAEGTVISVPYAFRFQNSNGTGASLHLKHLDNKGVHYLGPTFGDSASYKSLLVGSNTASDAPVSDQDFVLAVKHRKNPEVYPLSVSVNDDKTVTFKIRWVSTFRRAPGTYFVRWDNDGDGLFEIGHPKDNDRGQPMEPTEADGSPLICQSNLTECMNDRIYNNGYLDFIYTTSDPLRLEETINIRYEYIYNECKLSSDRLADSCYGKRAGLPMKFKGPDEPSFELEKRDEDLSVRNNYQHPKGGRDPVKIIIGRRHTRGAFSVRIYSQTGRLVFDNNGRWNNLLPSTGFPLIWRLKNNSGEKVGSGVYTVVLAARKGTFMKRVVVIRN